MSKTKSELDSMTKDELVEYADSIDVEVQHSWLKDDIVSAILKGQRAAAKQPTAVQAEETDMSDQTQAERESSDETEAEEAARKQKEEYEAERRPYKVTGVLNAKGRDYTNGEVILLSEEEHKALSEAGGCIEGVEAKTPEDIKAAHKEGREAMDERRKEQRKEALKAAAKAESERRGEEYNEDAEAPTDDDEDEEEAMKGFSESSDPAKEQTEPRPGFINPNPVTQDSRVKRPT